MKAQIATVLAVATFASTQSLAQSTTSVSDTELSKEIENPVTRRITLPLRYEADFLDGTYKARLEARWGVKMRIAIIVGGLRRLK